MRARASSSNGITPDDPRERWLSRMRDPEHVSPKYEPIRKTPGSKKLVFGTWVTVKADDADALPC